MLSSTEYLYNKNRSYVCKGLGRTHRRLLVVMYQPSCHMPIHSPSPTLVFNTR